MINRSKKSYFVYIMSNSSKTLYIGYTDNLKRRVLEHKGNKIDGFTKKYNITKLVYYEKYDAPLEVQNRKFKLKYLHREWKIKLIESVNKDWKDLFENYLIKEELKIRLLYRDK